MSRRGRPPVLDEVKKAEILAVLATGCSRQSAANYVGCDLKTIYNTAQRDPEFAEKLVSRESSVEVAHLVNLKNAGKETRFWRASAWSLERLLPDRYAARTPDTFTVEQFSQLVSAIAQMMVEEVPVDHYRKRMIARLEKLLGGTPERIEKRYRRRNNSAAKTAVFPRNSPSIALEMAEKPQNRLEKPEGTNRQSPKTAEKQPLFALPEN